MALVKICRVCGHPNDPTEFMCIACNADLSQVTPTKLKEEELGTSEAPSSAAVLYLRHAEGRLAVSAGGVVGRGAIGQKELAKYIDISRLHARFEKREGVWYVEDLGSMNGTYLNGQRISGSQALRSGDRLRLGRKVEFIVEIVEV